MQRALDTHDTALRALLARYYGYEVTTEGDSFTMAFHDPVDAVHHPLPPHLCPVQAAVSDCRVQAFHTLVACTHHLMDAWSASIYKLTVTGQVYPSTMTQVQGPKYNDPKVLIVYGKQAHTLPAS